jgi:hypothetical protein
MARLATIIMVMVGLMAMLNLMGIVDLPIWSIGENSSFASNFFWTALIVGVGVLAGGAIAGVGMGLLGGSTFNFVPGVAATAALVFGAIFLGYMIQVVNTVKAAGNTWVSYIVFLVFIVIEIGYAISVFDWARGTD